MKSFQFLLLVVSLLASVAFSIDVQQCYGIKDPANCRASYENSTQCIWCACKAVPSVCVDAAQAKKLPSGVFVCDSARSDQDRYLLGINDKFYLAEPTLRNWQGAAVQIAEAIAEKIAEHFIPNFATCITNIDAFYADMQTFSDHLNFSISDVKQALSSLRDGLKVLHTGIAQCRLTHVSQTVVVFIDKLDSVIGKIEVATQVIVDGVDIFEHLRAAVVSFQSHDYTNCGHEIADAITDIIH